MKIRPLIIDGDIAIVPLTRGYFAGIDVDDAEEVGKYNWHASITKKPNGAIKVYAARCGGEFSNTIYLHRHLIPGTEQVDHHNGNTLDDRRLNLRPADRFQNMRNVGSKGGTSRFKGVHKHSVNNSWIAQITVNRKCIHIGSFRTQEEAAEAYSEFSARLHGEYGQLNNVAMAA